MELRPEYLLPIIAKTLQDVVLPVLDQQQQVAQEQLKLAIGFLNVMAAQAPLQFAFDVDELRRFTAHAQAICASVDAAAAPPPALVAAQAACAGIGIAPATIVAATRDLRTCVTTMIEEGHGRGDAVRDAELYALVNDFARVQLDRERAWVLSMGFEDGADAVPSIASQLGIPG